MAEKRNIFLVGPMGAGKSTIGRQLAQQLNMEFFDSDQKLNAAPEPMWAGCLMSKVKKVFACVKKNHQ